MEILREGERADEIDQGIDEGDVDIELDPLEDSADQQDQSDRLGSDDIDGNDPVDDAGSSERPVETQGNGE
jgi:hypothetical protein